MNKPQITVIGGGTGTFVMLSGLKRYPVDLNAVISVADSGGSTGRLRDEFGFQPVGDLRQALAAMADEPRQTWIQKLLLYRFSRGSGLEGHNLGNLILTALQDMTQSTPEALSIATQIFELTGHIYPITTENIQLVIEYADGSVAEGEKNLDECHDGLRITKLSTKPEAEIYSMAAKAIIESEMVIIGPGDLYGSIMPNLIINGIKETFQQSRAKIVYVCNLMTRYTQTHNYLASDHVRTIESAIGKNIDYIVVNSTKIPGEIAAYYATQHEFQVEDNLTDTTQTVIRNDFLKLADIHQNDHDSVIRSYIRHDPEKIAQTIIELVGRK